MWLLTWIWWALQSDKTAGWEKKDWRTREKYYCRLAYRSAHFEKTLYPWNGYSNSDCTPLAAGHCNKMTSNSQYWFTYRQICLISKVNKKGKDWKCFQENICKLLHHYSFSLSLCQNLRRCKIEEQIFFCITIFKKEYFFPDSCCLQII